MNVKVFWHQWKKKKTLLDHISARYSFQYILVLFSMFSAFWLDQCLQTVSHGGEFYHLYVVWWGLHSCNWRKYTFQHKINFSLGNFSVSKTYLRWLKKQWMLNCFAILIQVQMEVIWPVISLLDHVPVWRPFQTMSNLDIIWQSQKGVKSNPDL